MCHEDKADFKVHLAQATPQLLWENIYLLYLFYYYALAFSTITKQKNKTRWVRFVTMSEFIESISGNMGFTVYTSLIKE